MEIIQNLEILDAEFLKELKTSIDQQNAGLIERIKDCNAVALTEWKRRFWKKADAAIKTASTWIEQMAMTRGEITDETIRLHADKLRAKNAETLQRMAKTKKRTPEALALLAKNFEQTVEEEITKLSSSLRAGDQAALEKGQLHVANRSVFETGAQRFIEGFQKDESELLDRFHASTLQVDETLLKNVAATDKMFREGLAKQATEAAPLDPMRAIATVNMRDKRRASDIDLWRSEKTADFLKILKHLAAHNAETLARIDAEFDKIPTETL